MLPESLLIMTAIAAPTATASPSVFNFHRGRETAVSVADILGFFGLCFLGAIRGECKGREYGDQSLWHASVASINRYQGWLCKFAIIGTGDFYTFDSNALFNSLDSLKPGEGCWVKMNEVDTLTVTSVAAGDGQNGGRSLAKTGGKTKLEEMKQHLVTYPSVPAICITEIRANGKQATVGSPLAA